MGCLVHLCEPRRSSDFPNGISPTSVCPSRAASLRFGFLALRSSCVTRVSVCTHACTEYGLQNDTRDSTRNLKVLRQGWTSTTYGERDIHTHTHTHRSCILTWLRCASCLQTINQPTYPSVPSSTLRRWCMNKTGYVRPANKKIVCMCYQRSRNQLVSFLLLYRLTDKKNNKCASSIKSYIQVLIQLY